MFTMRTTDQNVLLKVQLRIEKPLGQPIPPRHRLLRSRLVRKKKYFRLVTIMLLIDTGNSVSTICIIVLTGKRGGATTYATDVGSNASTNATTTTSIALCVVFNSNFQLSLKPKGILLYCFDCLFSFYCCFNTLGTHTFQCEDLRFPR